MKPSYHVTRMVNVSLDKYFSEYCEGFFEVQVYIKGGYIITEGYNSVIRITTDLLVGAFC